MHDYKINDEVAVYYAGKFHKRDHVASVKEYKRGTKITLAGGAIFDQHGQAWGDSYSRFGLAPMNEKVLAEIEHAKNVHTIRLAFSTDYSPEHAARIAEVIRACDAERGA